MEFVDAARLTSAVTMRSAVDVLEAAFAAPSLPETPERWHVEVGSGELLLMPSWDGASMGVKLVTVSPQARSSALPSVQGVYVLFDDNLTPVITIDGAALTGLRTAAVSGVATRHLARDDSTRLVVFGAGTQARWHVDAMREVLPIATVIIVSRSAEPAAALAASLDGVDARVGDVSDVMTADVICTCTTSSEPLFSLRDLSPGVHINAVGAYKPDRREVDADVVAAARVVVETRGAAEAEAGDLLLAIEEGAIDPSHIVADLPELVRGRRVRTSADDVTLFKSVGSAFEDLVIAREVAHLLKP